MTMNKA